MKKFLITNSLTGKKEEFKPYHPPKVLMYSCGPTVYGPIHIGNARALIFADLLYKWLKHIGYDVNFVRNYTDVDDRIIDRAKQEKIEAIEVADKYVEYCEKDIEILGLQKPVKTARVTESIPEIISLIEDILKNQHGYVVDGEVFFSIDSFKDYGKLSGKKVEDLIAGARVEVDSKKKSPADFSLWKPIKPGEPHWDSPWSKGRPGWHIECSAMVKKWLGDTIDIHHGGQDLIFPHHENEIAQSEAATHKPFCKYWVHNAFLTSGNEKMSKSLGNILPLRKFLESFGPELLKFFYLGFHVRSSAPYTVESMTQATNDLERIYHAKKWAVEAAKGSGAETSGAWASLLGKSTKVFGAIEDELYNDLNTPGALGHLFSFVREINRAEAEAAGKPGVAAPQSKNRALVAKEFLELLEKDLHSLFTVFAEAPEKMLLQIEVIRKQLAIAGGKSQDMPTDEEIMSLIQARNEARKNKDFKRADEIRMSLDSRGVILVDAPQGTTWKIK